ncbi:MAG: energy transducer TonB [Myxococcota bacterium]|nr:energy transducer TonB [Myxococcota bacterium]
MLRFAVLLASVTWGSITWASAAGGEDIDGIPLGPSPYERAAEIARRIQSQVVYPEIARRRGIEGTTLLRLRVSHDGRAKDLETASSSGSRLLDEAAHAGARSAEGLPVLFGRVEVPIRFSLEEPGEM